MLINEFDKDRTGTGTKEWADHTDNIQLGCSNNCRYCYAAESAARFKRRDRDLWAIEEPIERVDNRYPKRKGVIMFPSTHDITPMNIGACISFLGKVLAAGNSVLIVTKPDPDCIASLIVALEAHRERIMFRFTIGTMNEAHSLYWEPGAPKPRQRLWALQQAHAAGFRTSISMEPLLGGKSAAIQVFRNVSPYVTHTVWIGKMNRIKARVKIQHEYDHEWLDFLTAQQSDEGILDLVEHFKGEERVRWKDSIKKVIEQYRRVEEA